MRWYILKNRRFEGPFEEPEIRMGLQKAYWTAQDFALTEELLEREEFNYMTVAQVLGLSPKPVEIQQDNIVSSEKSEEEREEVTRIFEESLEAGDLVQKPSGDPISTTSSTKINYENLSNDTNEKKSSISLKFGEYFQKNWRYGIGIVFAVIVLAFIFEGSENKTVEKIERMPANAQDGIARNPIVNSPSIVRRPSSGNKALAAPRIQERPRVLDWRGPSAASAVVDNPIEAIPGRKKSAPNTKNGRKTPGNEDTSEEAGDEDLREPNGEDAESVDEENVDADEQDDVEDSQDVAD